MQRSKKEPSDWKKKQKCKVIKGYKRFIWESTQTVL